MDSACCRGVMEQWNPKKEHGRLGLSVCIMSLHEWHSAAILNVTRFLCSHVGMASPPTSQRTPSLVTVSLDPLLRQATATIVIAAYHCPVHPSRLIN